MQEHSSGEQAALLPPSYRKWNWGAMLLNVVWGAKYNIEVAFLTLIPIVGLIIPLLLGWKGNRWAWEKGNWESIEQFERVQKSWAFWGAIIWFFIFVILFIPLTFSAIHLKWQHSQVYQDAMNGFVKIEKISTMLGEPIRGRVTSVKKNSPENARFSVRVKGEKTGATVRFHVMKIGGEWSVYRMTLYNASRQAGIDFPLPEHMLLGDATEPSEQGILYNIVLEKSGDAELYALSHVLCELNQKLEEDKAIELIRYAPKIIYHGISHTGALKIKRKLEDYGARVTIEKQQVTHD